MDSDMDITTKIIIAGCILGVIITLALTIHFARDRCKSCRGDLLRHQPKERSCIRCGRTEALTLDTTGESGVRGQEYWRMTKPGRTVK